MNENRKTLELLKLLDMDGGEVVGERMGLWAEAFEAWLGERRTKFSPNVGEDSYNAWREFLECTRKAPWKVRVEDVEAYAEGLKARGLRPATIVKRLTGLSKFYEYCQKKGVAATCETIFNPVAQARRPKIEHYERATYLSQKEEAALLEAIRRDPSPMGKRDYALILTLLRTGRRAGEVRRLRWDEVSGGAGERGGRGTIPEEVLQAVREYLQAARRLEGFCWMITFLLLARSH